MGDPRIFYKKQLENHGAGLKRVKKQLFASSMVRLAVFCLAVLGIYLVFGNVKWIIALLLGAIVLFLFLVSRHSNLQYERDKILALIQINKVELDVLDYNFGQLPEGEGYKDPKHYFSQDIDLFGRGSFYQYINRTTLQQGSETLADLLTENSIDDIHEKQEAIRELGQIPEWRQEFSAVASLTKAETKTEMIVKWLEDHHPFVPRAMNYLPLLFSMASVGIVTCYFLGFLPESVLISWLVIGLGISGIFTKKITKLASDAAKVQSTFEQYNKLLTIIEETKFKADFLLEKKQRIIADGKKTSSILREFSKLLNNLDRNNNIFYLIFGNGLFLSGLATSYHIEQWIKIHGHAVKEWFRIIAFFDAQNSLGNFAFNHFDYTFPILSDGETILKATKAGHPLIRPEKCVLNDFQIGREQFLIITGANMAGKSTFLRTVSLQIVMANMGLPVCAQKTEYAPIKLITSMRTTDSLTDDESYFFSELKRLKFIVDEVQKDHYFIVLDEILKGTNSTDKAKGSRKFVERLVASKSTGIIATHDLSLCEVANELKQIENHYFDAEIIDDELHFDYKFKEGICQNMNASFLLKKMEIVP